MDEPASISVAYSPYERETIRDAEAALGAAIDPDPEGKVIEGIDTVRLDPIEDRDPLPTVVDALHTTTKEDVVRHEVLLRVGQPYRKVIADESARNIRKFARVSIVIVVAMRGSANDRVRVVVITKDVWSLVPDFDISATSGGIESMLLELDFDRDTLSDAAITGDVRVVTPRTPAGRLVFDTTATNRWRNYLNRQLVLGGEDRLRGYPTRFFQGKDLVAMNLEFRSRPVELASCHFGGALFYDAGAAFSGFDRLDPAQSAGFGLRAVFPQIDRAVLRVDVGFPIADDRVDPVSFFVTFGQAFKAAAIPPPLGP